MVAQPILDLSRLREAREMLGPAKFGTAVGLFRTQLDHSLEMAANAEAPDSGLKALAHQLASSAGFLGFDELSSTSRHLMSVTSGARQAVGDLQDAVVRARQALSDFAV